MTGTADKVHSDLRKAPRLARLCAVALSLAVVGCGSVNDAFDNPDEVQYVERSVEKIYNGAMDYLEAGWYETAAKEFDEVERQHPYSKWATKAQLMSAYSYYLNEQYDEAIVAIDRFIELHPGNRDTPYAYYLKALAYYVQISDVGRDQKMTRLALNALREVTKRYPNTNYARDAKPKFELTRDHLAGKDMDIGRYYQRRGNHLAAINRFRTVIKKYQTTTHVPEALHRLTESYLALGIIDEAKASAAVLGYNFPGSDWYVDSYALLGDSDSKPARKKSPRLGQSRDPAF